jgi:tetratricopeptide (TPR) repeat protein
MARREKPAEPEELTTGQAVELARGLTEGLTRIGGLASVDGLLGTLKNSREFAALAALGTALDAEGVLKAPAALRLTAQGLIECGRFEQARQILERIIARNDDPGEVLEARGLMGRFRKQIYVNQAVRGRPDAAVLIAAVNAYLTAYDEDPERPYWHGINAAALLARAARDGVKSKALPLGRQQQIAGEIREQLLTSKKLESDWWAMATVAEASLVLEEFDTAELWFHRAAWLANVSPFHIASTLRQLREVWQLDPARGMGARILPPLDARLYQKGQSLLITPEKFVEANQGASLEKVFGTSPFMPFQAWALAGECAKSVCRVEDKLNQGIGTGFVVNGRELHPKLPNEPVLITNAHVLSPKGDADSLTAAQAHVSFYASPDKNGKAHTSTIKKILWSSPRDKLDATVATLGKPLKTKTPLSIAPALPAADSKQRVYVIGHPGGGGLMFSLNDNELLDHGDPGDPRVHYRTPTEPGSSGSPVFNSAWELIALHHAGDAAIQKVHGGGTYQANEGLALKHIRSAIKT